MSLGIIQGECMNKIIFALKLFIINPFLFFRKLRNRFIIYWKILCGDPKTLAYREWIKCNGDSTLLINCQLNPGDIVFDVGGYVGDFAAEMVKRYNSRVYIFEPVFAFHNKCISRFASNSMVECYQFGLSARDAEMEISLSAEASSSVRNIPGTLKERIRMCCLNEFVKSHAIDSIKLFKVNIEGGEYELLEHILDSGLITCIENFKIQFHDFVPQAETLRNQLRRRLSDTHKEEWCYPFIWESWVRKIKLA